MKKPRVINIPRAVVIRDGKLLVVVKQFPTGITYLLPGGHQKFGETLIESLVRECFEELGFKPTVGELLCVQEYIGSKHKFAETDANIHSVNILFNCVAPDDYDAQPGDKPDQDQIGVTWLALEDLEEENFYPRGVINAIRSRRETSAYLGEML